jgi:DNA-binding response OmpR family regulator
LLGVDSPGERARLMKSGFGEALGGDIARDELVARVRRVRCAAQSMWRQLRAGPVTLDLFHRDGRVDKRWLGLHPREFALFWRLAEAQGERVSRRALLTDVWRLEHDPESNRLEVHVSRLRSKLAIFRLSWLVVTDPRGGYRLHSDRLRSAFAFGMASPTAYERALVMPGGDAFRDWQQEGA